MSTLSGAKKMQVFAQSLKMLLSSMYFLFLSMPQTTGKGAPRKSSQGMMLTTSNAQVRGLVRICANRQMVQVRIWELSQMKTTRFSSIMTVQISSSTSRENMDRMVKAHSSMKQVFARFQSVNKIIFQWLISLSQQERLKATSLALRSFMQPKKSSSILLSWKRESVSLMFSSLCLQIVRRSILMMLMSRRRIYSQKEKKGQYEDMQNTRCEMNMLYSELDYTDLADEPRLQAESAGSEFLEGLDRVGSSSEKLMLQASSSLGSPILFRELLLVFLVGLRDKPSSEREVQSWIPTHKQKSVFSGLIWLRKAFLQNSPSSTFSWHLNRSMKDLRFVQQYDIIQIAFYLAFWPVTFLTAMPEGKTRRLACLSTSEAGLQECSSSGSNPKLEELAKQFFMDSSLTPNTEKFSIMLKGCKSYPRACWLS